jgi:outer membrane lipoprotein carrier protein
MFFCNVEYEDLTPMFCYTEDMKRVLLLLCCALAINAQSVDDIAKRTESRLRSMKSLQAEFIQTYYSSSVSAPLVEKGRVFIQKPGWMRWDYLNPEKKTFLLKESLYQEYYPEDKQVVQSNLSEEEGDIDFLGLLRGTKGIQDNFVVEPTTFPTENQNVHQLKLIPKRGDPETYIMLEVDAETWLVLTAISFDWAGNRQVFEFSQIDVDTELPKDTFELKLPPDVDIIK